MAIDETTPEFECCNCDWTTIAAHQQLMTEPLTADELKASLEG